VRQQTISFKGGQQCAWQPIFSKKRGQGEVGFLLLLTHLLAEGRHEAIPGDGHGGHVWSTRPMLVRTKTSCQRIRLPVLGTSPGPLGKGVCRFSVNPVTSCEEEEGEFYGILDHSIFAQTERTCGSAAPDCCLPRHRFLITRGLTLPCHSTEKQRCFPADSCWYAWQSLLACRRPRPSCMRRTRSSRSSTPSTSTRSVPPRTVASRLGHGVPLCRRGMISRP
jgi:hypothetical protein